MEKGRKDLVKFLGLVVLIAVIVGTAYWLDIYTLADLDHARKIIESYGIWSGLVFSLAYAALTILLIPMTPFTIAAGILFGIGMGTFYVIVGAVLGASVAFIVAKGLGEDFVESFLESRHKRIYGWDKKLENHGFPVVLFLRLIPIFPFVVLNYALGLTKVKTKHYILATALGIAPAAFVGALFGDAIIVANTANITIAVVLYLLLIAIWPIWIWVKKRKNRR